MNIGAEGRPLRVPSANVSASLFGAFAVRRVMGALQSRRDAAQRAAHRVLSSEIWQSAFGGIRPSLASRWRSTA